MRLILTPERSFKKGLKPKQAKEGQSRIVIEFFAAEGILYICFSFMNGRLRENIEGVRRRIKEAARRAGRPPHEITLLAVSKTVSPERIREAHGAGITHFGESRVQEAVGKMKVGPIPINQFPDFAGDRKGIKAISPKPPF